MKDPVQVLALEYALYGLLALFLLVAVAALWISHRSARYQEFQLIDLITNATGVISRPALMELSAFIIMTWGFIVFVVRGQLSEWYAGVYVGVFVVRGAFSAYLSASKPNGQQPTQPGVTS